MAVWHSQTADEALAVLRSSPTGLTAAEAQRRLAEHGRNELKEQPRQSPFMMFIGQFRDFMIVVLMVAAMIAGTMGEWTDTFVIMAIVLLNATLGFIQEYRAEQAMAALRRMAAPMALVVRDGAPEQIPAVEVVPGDVVLLEAGNVVPADLRLIEAVRLTVEEAALTGESVPVEKLTAPLVEENLSLGDRRNMCYKGTVLTGGRGRGVAVATGMVTIALALGAARLVWENTLIKKLPAVETLGSVTYICSDKTGTLTQNRMTVERIVAADGDLLGGVPNTSVAEQPAGLLITAMALCNDAGRGPEGRVIGDPTEAAIYTAAAAWGYVKEELAGERRLAELPFDAERRCMTIFHRLEEGLVSFTKGAPATSTGRP